MGIIRFKYSRLWAWQLSGYPESVLQNGVGRYVCQLQRVIFHFCKINLKSSGTRRFIENDLLDFAHKNPNIVVYLHPLRVNSPFMQGEYLNGRICNVSTINFEPSDIKKWLEYLRTRSGQRIVRYEQHNRTEIPSVQGLWHPFLNYPTEMNVAKYPDENLGLVNTDEKSATEILMEIAKQKRENIKILE